MKNSNVVAIAHFREKTKKVPRKAAAKKRKLEGPSIQETVSFGWTFGISVRE